MDDLLSFIRRDLLIASRSLNEWLQSLVFFVMFIALTGIAFGGDNQSLSQIAAAIIWLALIFALLLSFETMFKSDFDDGTLDQLQLTPIPTASYVIGKALSHWSIIILPLLLALPIVIVLFGMTISDYAGLLFSVLCASPALIVLGAFCAACLVGNRNSHLLVILLAIPLFVPLIIFGTSAVQSYSIDGLNAVELKALIGVSLITCAIGIPATAAALDALFE